MTSRGFTRHLRNPVPTPIHASIPEGTINVNVESEGQSLAKGYEKAFTQLPSGAKFVVIKTEKGAQYLNDSVKSVEAIEAVLVIHTDNGLTYIINAHDIIKITNLRPKA